MKLLRAAVRFLAAVLSTVVVVGVYALVLSRGSLL